MSVMRSDTIERGSAANPEAERALRRDGACLIRRALDPVELRIVGECFDWSVANPSDNANQFEPTPTHPGRFYADINNPNLFAPGNPYREFLTRSRLAERLSSLWGGSDVWFLYEQVLLKEGEEARRTPWHQDSSYLPIAGEMLAIVWVALEPCPRELSLEFVGGSHRGPLYDGSKFDPGDDTAPLHADGLMPRLPDIEAARDDFPILGWGVSPGDILVFHPATLHGGAPTLRGTRRRTVSLRFFGEDATYRPLPTDGVESIGIEGETIWKRLQSRLVDGSPLRDPGLRKLWPRDETTI
jgi:hypothetical protein